MAQSVGEIALDIVMGKNTVGNSISEAMKECQKTVSDASVGISGKINAIGEASTKVGASIMPMSTGVVAMGTACVNTANDIDKAVNSYLTATGTATSGAEEFKDVMSDIYANNYGESFEDIADAMSKVKTNIADIDDTEIQQATESAIALRDTFGYDVAESTRSVDTLMKQFGITSEQAFDLITQGAQSGMDYSGELMDSIDEYSVQFGKLGLDAEDMFSIFANGAENGAFNLDKVGDAVKELSIRVVDGSNTTAEGFTLLGLNADEMASKFAMGGDSAKSAFEEVINGLASMDDPLAQNTAGVDLFGTMWEDLGANVVTSLSPANDSISATKNSMEQLKEVKYDDVASQFAGLGRTIQMDVVAPLGESLLPVLSSVVGGVSNVVAKFGELSPTAQKVILTVGGIIAVAGPLLILFGKLASSISSIGGLFGKASGSIGGFAQSAGSATAPASSAGGAIGALAKNALGFIALGAGILLASAGLSLLAKSAIELANAGAPAVVALVSMVGAIALFAVGAAALAPALTAGAVGLVAFGGAVALVGAGVLLASSGITLLATQLPTISEYGLSASVNILALGGALVVFGAGALTASVGALPLSVALVALGVALVACGASALVASAGILAMSAGVIALSAGVLLLSVGLKGCGTGMQSIASNALIASTNSALLTVSLTATTLTVTLLTVGITALNVISLALTVTILALTVSVVAHTVALGVLTIAMGAGAVACGVLAVAVNALAVSIEAIRTVTSGTTKDMSNGFTSAKNTVTGIFDSIGDKISGVMNGAKNVVSGAIEKIKGFFDFDWKLPKLKLPHFKIDGEFSLTPPSVPHFSIDWYAKAMDNGMILNSPTIFGMNSNGQPMGAGEAGSETVVGTNSLMDMIKSAVSGSMGAIKIEAPALNNVRAGSSSTVQDESKINELIELIKKLIDKDDNTPIPIYIGNELIDEYILNKNSRTVLRSGGRA